MAATKPYLGRQEDVLKQLRKSEASKVKVAVSDIDGVMRGKYVQLEKFLQAAESGMPLCSIVFGRDCADRPYDGVGFTGWHTGFPDAKVNIDLATFRSIPWDGGMPFVIGDFVDDSDRPLPICPRQLLKQIVAQAEVDGLFPVVGLELEWLNVRETSQSLAQKSPAAAQPLAPGMLGYSLLTAGEDREYMNALFEQMREFDVPLEALHTETGPGVFEAAIVASDALEAADRGALLKAGVREIAARFGLTASFIARWSAGQPGSSGHIHQSLRNADNVNLFHDGSDQLRMSRMFKSYVAGLVHCLPDILPLFAPTVNSYKRFVEGYWAPTRVTWGRDNRTSAVRIIPGGPTTTRMELRVGGADINPYLAVAATVAAGLYGIENQLTLTAPMVDGNAYEYREAARLAQDLGAATERFEQSQLARELFGDKFVDHFAATRRWEWREFQRAVTDWELKRYFSII